jgi:hypothetical protein
VLKALLVRLVRLALKVCKATLDQQAQRVLNQPWLAQRGQQAQRAHKVTKAFKVWLDLRGRQGRKATASQGQQGQQVRKAQSERVALLLIG